MAIGFSEIASALAVLITGYGAISSARTASRKSHTDERSATQAALQSLADDYREEIKRLRDEQRAAEDRAHLREQKIREEFQGAELDTQKKHTKEIEELQAELVKQKQAFARQKEETDKYVQITLDQAGRISLLEQQLRALNQERK